MTQEKNRTDSEKIKLGRVGERPYWVLYLSVFIRAIHQVGAAVFLASFLLKEIITVPHLYLWIVLISGALLLFTEGLRHRQILREFSGIGTMFKLVILGFAYHGWMPAAFCSLFAFVFASISSHAPKKIRHRLIF